MIEALVELLEIVKEEIRETSDPSKLGQLYALLKKTKERLIMEEEIEKNDHN